MKDRNLLLIAVFFLLIGVVKTIFAVQNEEVGNEREREALMIEEAEDYFRKLLEEDVVYIISGEERAVFENLRTAEEKEQFIEQFLLLADELDIYLKIGPIRDLDEDADAQAHR